MPPMACMPPAASPGPEGRPASNSASLRLPSPSASSWLNTSSLLTPIWLAVPPDMASSSACNSVLLTLPSPSLSTLSNRSSPPGRCRCCYRHCVTGQRP